MVDPVRPATADIGRREEVNLEISRSPAMGPERTTSTRGFELRATVFNETSTDDESETFRSSTVGQISNKTGKSPIIQWSSSWTTDSHVA